MVSHTRVKTPTAAAERLIQQLTDVADRLDNLQARVQQGACDLLDREYRRLDALQSRIPHLVQRKLMDARLALLTAQKDLSQVALASLARERHRLELLRQRTDDASPVKLLKRGYSITLKNGKAVTDVSSLNVGDTLVTRLAQGEVISVVSSSRAHESTLQNQKKQKL